VLKGASLESLVWEIGAVGLFFAVAFAAAAATFRKRLG
jgi:hypothetical protein